VRGSVAVALVLSTLGCDTVFQLERDEEADIDAPIDEAIDAPLNDLDRDGMPDETDLCHAPIDDGVATDIDDDDVFDASDMCPYDRDNGLDPDEDMLGNNCDPYPDLPGNKDRRRCLMRFSDLPINSMLWQVRPPDAPWASEPGMLLATPAPAGMTLASTVVAQSIEGANVTTYDALFQVTQASDGSITIWMRADPAGPASGDLGCRFVTVGAATRFGVVRGAALGPSMILPALPIEQSYVRIRGRITTAGGLGSTASVRCQITTDVSDLTVSSSLALPAGRFAMTADRWRVELRALVVFDQP